MNELITQIKDPDLQNAVRFLHRTSEVEQRDCYLMEAVEHLSITQPDVARELCREIPEASPFRFYCWLVLYICDRQEADYLEAEKAYRTADRIDQGVDDVPELDLNSRAYHAMLRYAYAVYHGERTKAARILKSFDSGFAAFCVKCVETKDFERLPIIDAHLMRKKERERIVRYHRLVNLESPPFTLLEAIVLIMEVSDAARWKRVIMSTPALCEHPHRDDYILSGYVAHYAYLGEFVHARALAQDIYHPLLAMRAWFKIYAYRRARARLG